MKITLYEYKRLPEKKQHEILHNEGDFIEVVTIGKERYVLFGLSNFYVELTYDINDNAVTRLRSFRQGELLEKYF